MKNNGMTAWAVEPLGTFDITGAATLAGGRIRTVPDERGHDVTVWVFKTWNYVSRLHDQLGPDFNKVGVRLLNNGVAQAMMIVPFPSSDGKQNNK